MPLVNSVLGLGRLRVALVNARFSHLPDESASCQPGVSDMAVESASCQIDFGPRSLESARVFTSPS